MLESLESLASGQLEGDFLAYSSPYDASSPWSLVVALVPETVPARHIVNYLAKAPLSKPEGATQSLGSKPAESMSDETAVFILAQCRQAGWLESGETSLDSVARHFARVRLEQIDRYGGELDWPATDNVAKDPWYRGILRAVSLYRTYYSSTLDLALLEAQAPEQGLAILLQNTAPARVVRDLEYMALPYLRYVKRLDLLDAWLSEQPMSTLVAAARIPEASKAILAQAFQRPLDLPALNSLKDSLPASDPQLSLEVEKLRDAVKTAAILVPSVSRLEQVVEYTEGTEAMQRGLLNVFSLNQPRDQTDFSTLNKTVFSKLSESDVRLQLLRGSLQGARFMHLRKSTWDPDVLATEVLEYVHIAQHSSDFEAQFPNALTALGLVDPATIKNEELKKSATKTKAQYNAIRDISARHHVPLRLILDQKPLNVVESVLEYDTGSYNRPAVLVSLAERLGAHETPGTLPELVKERCVEAALVDDNLKAALSLTRDLKGSNAWLSWLQVAKFLSPSWDDGRPPHVLREQLAAAVKAVESCPPDDLSSVLRTWQSLEDESSSTTIVTSGRSASPEPAKAPFEHDIGKRAPQNLKKMFVSGLGWAIGATPREEDQD